MEIVKQNETFSLSDTTPEGWNMVGSASKSANGDLSINFSVQKIDEPTPEIGTFNYLKPNIGNLNIHYSVMESNKDKFISYSNTVVTTILTNFN